MKLNKKDLVDSITEKTGMTKKDSRVALNATIESIQEALGSGEVEVETDSWSESTTVVPFYEYEPFMEVNG